jgi:hypothetical protein
LARIRAHMCNHASHTHTHTHTHTLSLSLSLSCPHASSRWMSGAHGGLGVAGFPIYHRVMLLRMEHLASANTCTQVLDHKHKRPLYLPPYTPLLQPLCPQSPNPFAPNPFTLFVNIWLCPKSLSSLCQHLPKMLTLPPIPSLSLSTSAQRFSVSLSLSLWSICQSAKSFVTHSVQLLHPPVPHSSLPPSPLPLTLPSLLYPFAFLTHMALP